MPKLNCRNAGAAGAATGRRAANKHNTARPTNETARQAPHRCANAAALVARVRVLGSYDNGGKTRKKQPVPSLWEK